MHDVVEKVKQSMKEVGKNFGLLLVDGQRVRRFPWK